MLRVCYMAHIFVYVMVCCNIIGSFASLWFKSYLLLWM